MSASAGKNGSLLLDGYELATVISWGVELSIASHDQTPVNSAFARHKVGLQQWSLTIEGVCDTEDQGTEKIVVGASVDVELYPGGDDYDQRRITGTATITSLSDAGSADSILTFSAQLQGQGELKREAQQYLGIFNATLAGFAFAGGGQYAADSTGILRKVEEDSPAYPGGYWDSDAEEWRPGSNVGVLLEDERANLIEDSTDFEGQWGLAADRTEVIVNQITAPDGTMTGGLIRAITGSNTGEQYLRRLRQAAEVSNSSVYLKKHNWRYAVVSCEDKRIFDLDTGLFIDGKVGDLVEELPYGWFRVSVTDTTRNYLTIGTAPDANGFNWIVAPANNEGVYAWGPQFEAGSFPSSYIPTLGGEVTRPATDMQQSLESLGLPDLVNNFSGQFVFTLKADWEDLPDSAPLFTQFQNNLNYIRIEKTVGFDQIHYYGYADSVYYQVNADFAPSKGDVVDLRWRRSSTTGATLWINGGNVGTHIAGANDFAIPLDSVRVGQSNDGARHSFIAAHKLRIVPEALSDAEIESWS